MLQKWDILKELYNNVKRTVFKLCMNQFTVHVHEPFLSFQLVLAYIKLI